MEIFYDLIREMVDQKGIYMSEVSWDIQKQLVCKCPAHNSLIELPFNGFVRNWRETLIETFNKLQLMKNGPLFTSTPIEIVEVRVIGKIVEMQVGNIHTSS
ncbi:hypothetical protein AA0X95_17055 [Bacillus sp. 1P10SD]|uniref:hypothetical protein n=1 Tax=Bacillus sp. 1P10SD TaxID=3132265 RepID=UPI0039A5E131